MSWCQSRPKVIILKPSKCPFLSVSVLIVIFFFSLNSFETKYASISPTVSSPVSTSLPANSNSLATKSITYCSILFFFFTNGWSTHSPSAWTWGVPRMSKYLLCLKSKCVSLYSPLVSSNRFISAGTTLVGWTSWPLAVNDQSRSSPWYHELISSTLNQSYISLLAL